MSVYIKHAGSGAVHSVTEEHYNTYLTEPSKVDGSRYPLPGVSVITEDEAREANPQLFGAWDPQVVFTPAELVAQATYQKQLAEFQRDHESNRRRRKAEEA